LKKGVETVGKTDAVMWCRCGSERGERS